MEVWKWVWDLKRKGWRFGGGGWRVEVGIGG